MNKSRRKYWFLLILPFFLVLYASFPTQNSSIDAWAYAAQVKHESRMYNPHHLLYNGSQYLLYKVPVSMGLNVPHLEFMKLVNALIATLCLLMLMLILVKLKKRSFAIVSLSLFTGASFTVMRFATENEVYLFPVLFSLTGSYFFVKYYIHRKSKFNALLCGIFTAFAALYHQLHFFWWMAFFIAGIYLFITGKRNFIIPYFLPALLVPLVYFLTLYHASNGWVYPGKYFRFIFHDFYTGTASIGINLMNFVFTGINSIRTFYQAHGYLWELVKHQPLYIFPAVLSIFLLLLAIYVFFRNKKGIRLKREFIAISFAGVFLLHLIMAFFSRGNAEFMVMLPFVLSIIITAFSKIPYRAFLYAAMSMLLWNFFFGIYPLNRYKFSAEENIARMMLHQPEKKYILHDKILVDNIYFYYTGKFADATWFSPSEYHARTGSTRALEDLIETEQNVFTDCTGKPVYTSRASMIEAGHNEQFFSGYNLNSFDSFKVFDAFHHLFHVSGKN